MKFFGEYLVSKGIINEDQLVQTLIEQSKVTPMAIEIAYQKKLMSPKNLLDISKTQMEKKIDFKTACLELKLWSTQIESEIESGIHSSRTPLGHMLIKKGITDLSTITKAMDDFLSRMSAPASQQADKPAVVAPPSRIESAATLSAFSNVFLDEFLNYLSPSKVSSINNLLKAVDLKGQSSDIYLSTLKNILTEVHIIRGLMKTLKLEKADQMNQMFEMYSIRLIDTKCTPEFLQFLPTYSNLGQEMLPLLVDYSKSLLSNPSSPSSAETAWYQNEQNASTYTNLFQKITDACLEVI